MCGRYELKIDGNDHLSKQIRKKIEQTSLPVFSKGEVFPNDNCLLIIPKGDGLIDLSVKKWGISLNTLLINARIETLEEKALFKKMLKNPCAIIASGFYEWNNSNKYLITNDSPLLFLAGLYNDNNEFVILTGEANNKMKDIHHRSPVIFNQEEMLKYLYFKQKPYINNENLNITRI